MGKRRIYLDYAATTPVHPEVLRAMEPYWSEEFGNPSSIHNFGRQARDAIEKARESVASIIGAKPEEIVFTSGGTESNNFAIIGVAYALAEKGRHIITSAVEHHAVIEPCKFLEKQGFEVTYLPVDGEGFVAPEDVKSAIRDDTILISIMHANNEVGTIEPVEEIGAIAREAGVIFHTDAVQTVGHVEVSVDRLRCDLLSVSAHKLYGPKGIGALYIRRGTRIARYMHGGEQERKRRAGTHNVPAIVGFGKACEIAKREMPEEAQRLEKLRDWFINEVERRIDHIRLNGPRTHRLPNNINFVVEYVEGEAMILRLDMAGIAASTGSACSSGSLEPSHVLLAMGLPHELAHGSLRFTLGKWTEKEELEYTLDVLENVVNTLRQMSPFYKSGG